MPESNLVTTAWNHLVTKHLARELIIQSRRDGSIKTFKTRKNAFLVSNGRR